MLPMKTSHYFLDIIINKCKDNSKGIIGKFRQSQCSKDFWFLTCDMKMEKPLEVLVS